MKKRFVKPQFVTKGTLVFISIFLLLSPASGSVILAGNRSNGYFYGSANTIEILLLGTFETSALLFTPESSYLLTGSREGKNKHLERVSPFLILAIGILAGFNPCLLAVMAFLASITLAQQGGRKEMLKITLGFSAGIFTMYMFAGISILSTVSLLPEVRRHFTAITILLTALLGLWHIYDAYWLKTHAKSTFRTPKSLKDFMSRMGEKNLLLLSFLAGGMFSLVKAPCVGAIYLSILSVLAIRTDIVKGIAYMGIYNLGLLLPVVCLGLLLAFGLSPKKVTEFREKRRVEIRLTTGLILIALALLMQFRIL
ncbi:cytochrome c biogenesis CcdA family protein [Methanosarcina sp. DH2]|jgi:cytochrome c biogenesis protein CcdA|uniref:cytochrome c biogenesis CcdA family protein n=1 Tax=Methanosarcina sp. DH2 TaxID=2605639 RepID=UPI001E5939E9|nr:cytochrome c biogenesis CcdA family protein [Methanosarcina sp. DH2]